jgi:hypothetical protein
MAASNGLLVSSPFRRLQLPIHGHSSIYPDKNEKALNLIEQKRWANSRMAVSAVRGFVFATIGQGLFSPELSFVCPGEKYVQEQRDFGRPVT